MNELAPSAYHDPREVVWKHIVAQTYWDTLDLLRRDGIAEEEFDAIRYSFLKPFNSHYDLEILCRQAEASASALVAMLEERGHSQTAATLVSAIAVARERLSSALEPLRHVRQVERGQSYVVDGRIDIAGKAAEDFAVNPDFIGACLELVGEDSAHVVGCARAAWQRGFALDSDSIDLVRSATQAGWSADDVQAEIVLREQRSGAYPSLQEHEFREGRAPAENRQAKLRAIGEGYTLLGKLMSCTALTCAHSAPIDARRLAEDCPIAATVKQAGLRLSPEGVAAFRRFMLVRCSHGLNPGEFAARIAASVRTTFPQALLASLMVRSGKVHAGAIAECMQHLDSYLAAPSRIEFAEGLLRTGELYGFGHRIHKRTKLPGGELHGGDPRVAYLLDEARKAFPGMRERIAVLEEFATMVQRLKPTIAPNGDFASAIWCHCLGLPPAIGSGIFTIGRLPGLISQVINQLDYKANALRPPLAVNLPYPA